MTPLPSTPGQRVRLGLAGALGVGAALLVACGTSGSSALLTRSNADQLKADFDAVQSAVTSGGCGQNVKNAVAQARNDLAALPATLDPNLRKALADGVNTLGSRAPIECQQQTTQTTVTTNTNTNTTTSTPTTNTNTTTSTPTTTTNTTTTNTTTTDTTPTGTGTTPTQTDTGPTTTPTTAPGGGTPAPNGQSGQVNLGADNSGGSPGGGN